MQVLHDFRSKVEGAELRAKVVPALDPRLSTLNHHLTNLISPTFGNSGNGIGVPGIRFHEWGQ